MIRCKKIFLMVLLTIIAASIFSINVFAGGDISIITINCDEVNCDEVAFKCCCGKKSYNNGTEGEDSSIINNGENNDPNKNVCQVKNEPSSQSIAIKKEATTKSEVINSADACSESRNLDSITIPNTLTILNDNDSNVLNSISIPSNSIKCDNHSERYEKKTFCGVEIKKGNI